MTGADILPNSELLTGGNSAGAHIGLGGLRSADGRAFPLLNVKVRASLAAVKLALDAGGVRVASSARATLNKDFILEFSTADSAAPVTRAWTNGGCCFHPCRRQCRRRRNRSGNKWSPRNQKTKAHRHTPRASPRTRCPYDPIPVCRCIADTIPDHLSAARSAFVKC